MNDRGPGKGDPVRPETPVRPEMDCARAREGLWPPERPRIDGDLEHAAREHVRTCPECARYFMMDRRLLESLDGLRRRRAPMAVRDRVVAALASARLDAAEQPSEVAAVSRPRRVRPAALIGVAAGLAGLAIVGSGGVGTARAGESAFVEDYLRRAVAEDHLETDDRDAVAHFLTRELGLHVPPLDAPGLEIVRVEICLLDGERGAMIVYRLDGREISHYVMPRAGVGVRPVRVAERGRIEGGLPLVTWATDEVEQAVVGEVSANRLLAVVREGTPAGSTRSVP